MRYSKEEIKAEYIRLYGENFDEIRYKDFDEFFEDTWENWCPKYGTNLEDLYEIVLDISEMPQPFCPPAFGWEAEEKYLASQKQAWEEEEARLALLLEEELEQERRYLAWQEENLEDFEWEE